MSETKIYPKGITFFKPHEKAPSFVLGNIIVNANEFYQWMQDNKHLLVDNAKYGKQFKFQLTDKGLSVDTWQPTTGHKDFQPEKKVDEKAEMSKQVVDDDLPW